MMSIIQQEKDTLKRREIEGRITPSLQNDSALVLNILYYRLHITSEDIYIYIYIKFK
jgi:hypothetical protein